MRGKEIGRYIPLPPIAARVLERQALRRVPDNPPVFPSRRRPGRSLENLRGAWARLQLPRFLCAGCGCGEAAGSWPSHYRFNP
jgi:hypothetical protein